MKYPEIPKQFNELFEVLKLKGCPTILATSFIQNNFEYLKKKSDVYFGLSQNTYDTYKSKSPNEQK